MAVGVHVHAEVARLLETLGALEAHSGVAFEVLLLPDGADEATTTALATHPMLARRPQSGTVEPRGAPACFNRLLAQTSTEVLVLLESGTVVAPGCLDLLVGALGQPGRSLAGPSTNRSWNQQAVALGGRGTSPSLDQAAAFARQRFGSAARALAPLHSLADFCYAVRRDVVDAIGGADEGYGTGPCWEIDYNIRAARAGFAGVWVGAAYAHRHPMTARRQAAERELMEASKRRYQDRFCGLRLRGEAAGYEAHCRGDDCEHFAPAGLVAVALTPQASARLPTPAAPATTPAFPAAPPASPAAIPALRAAPPGPRPALVSCLMPTRDRPDLARQAVKYFLAQDYPHKELVIVEDGPPRLAPLLPDDTRIRLVSRAPAATASIGALRNQACQLARGDILLQFDDDDWHGPARVSRQAAAIAGGDADITGLRDCVIFDLDRWQFWQVEPALHRRLFVRDVHGGTLAYRRQVWEKVARYPNCSLAEDAAFVDQAVRRGARLRGLTASGDFLYIRHGANAWQLRCGSTVDPAGWRLVPEPALPASDRAFYVGLSPGAPSPADDRPLVSCIMPTYQRRPFVAQAIALFLRQDYPTKELVIVDDGRDTIGDLVPDHPAISYHRLPTRTILGAKRNQACELARGLIIAHWDDDDWVAPDRLSVQVARLQESGAEVSGARSLGYYDPWNGRAWRYSWPSGARPWAAGPTLCFTKALWARAPFPPVAVGEDTRFTWSAAVGAIADISDADCFVALVHPANTAVKAVDGAYWAPRPVEEVERRLGDDLAFYRRLAGEPAAL